jgi:hypothetical protein
MSLMRSIWMASRNMRQTIQSSICFFTMAITILSMPLVHVTTQSIDLGMTDFDIVARAAKVLGAWTKFIDVEVAFTLKQSCDPRNIFYCHSESYIT